MKKENSKGKHEENYIRDIKIKNNYLKDTILVILSILILIGVGSYLKSAKDLKIQKIQLDRKINNDEELSHG